MIIYDDALSLVVNNIYIYIYIYVLYIYIYIYIYKKKTNHDFLGRRKSLGAETLGQWSYASHHNFKGIGEPPNPPKYQKT